MPETIETETKSRINGQVHPDWYVDLMGGQWVKLGKYNVGLVKFVPDVSGLILDNHNKENRRPVQTQISMLSRDMGESNFPVTGETIIFSTTRNLINGQNRLYACVNSGKPFTTFVVVGVDPSVFQVMDQHSKRTGAQVLQMMGEVSANNLASALSHLNRLLLTGDLYRGSPGSREKGMTVPERIALLEEHPGIREAVGYFISYRQNFCIFPGFGMPGALRYLFDFAHRNHCTKFWDSLGSMSIPDEPRWNATRLLLKRLVAEKSGNKEERSTIRRVGAWTIKAWNSLVDSQPMDRLQWQDFQEDFPKISGIKYGEGNRIIL